MCGHCFDHYTIRGWDEPCIRPLHDHHLGGHAGPPLKKGLFARNVPGLYRLSDIKVKRIGGSKTAGLKKGRAWERGLKPRNKIKVKIRNSGLGCSIFDC